MLTIRQITLFNVLEIVQSCKLKLPEQPHGKLLPHITVLSLKPGSDSVSASESGCVRDCVFIKSPCLAAVVHYSLTRSENIR